MYSWRDEFGEAFVGRKVLVTGATGFIGWHLCEGLVALGAEVHGASRAAHPQNLPSGCGTWPVDLREIEAVRSMISEMGPQLIYHLAGTSSARQDINLVLPTLQNNLVGTVHILLAASEVGCERVIFAGSSEELNEVPASPYAAAKVGSSMYARMFHRVYGLPVVIVRAFMTYGARQEATKVIPYATVTLLRGESPELASGERVCDFIYVIDVVRGMLKAALQPNLEGATLDLGTGEGYKVREAINLLVELTRSSARPTFGALPDRAGERSPLADRAESSRKLGWEPRWSLRDGLLETVAWYREMANRRTPEG